MTVRMFLVVVLVSVVVGVGSWFAAAIGGHLWADHQLIDAIRANIQQQQQAAQPPKTP